MKKQQRIEDHDDVIHARPDSAFSRSGQNGRWHAKCEWVGGKTRGKHVVATCLRCVGR